MKSFLPKIGHFLSVEKTYLPRAVAEADQILERWDVPHEVNGQLVSDFAPDLDDRSPRWWRTKQGSRISGRLLNNDLVLGGASPATTLLMGLLPLLALATLILGMLPSALGTLGGFIGMAAIACVAVALWRAAGKGIAMLATFLGVIIPGAFARSAIANGASGFSPMAFLDHLMANASGATMAVGLVAVTAVIFFAAGSVSRARVAFMYAVGLVALLAVLSAISGVLGHLGAPFAIAPFFLLGAGLPWAWSELDWQHWIMRLHAQDTAAPAESTMGSADGHMKARQQQAENALRDKSPVTVVGTAIVTGATGSGKTVFLRDQIAQWVRAGNFGMFVLDEKDLPGELRGLDRYTLIEPGVRFGLLEGLNPTEVTTAMYSEGDGDSKSSSGKFFESASRTMFLHAGVATKALIELELGLLRASGVKNVADQDKLRQFKWTVASIRSTLQSFQNPDNMAEMIANCRSFKPASEGEQHMLDGALDYFEVTLPTMDSDTRSNIRETLAQKLDGLTSHPDLVAFAHTEKSEGFDIRDILRSGRFGVNLPKVRYGHGGLMVMALVKQRVFSLLRLRATYDWQAAGETPILGVIDEAAGLIGKDDVDFMKVARSFGYAALYALQNFDAIVVRLGSEPAAQALLDNFRSKVSLVSSNYTYQVISKALGMTHRLKWTGPSAGVNFVRSLTLLAESALLDPTHPGASFLRTLLRRGHGFFKEPSDGSHGFSGHIHRRKEISAEEDVFKINPIQQCEMKAMPLLEEHEWDAYLAEKFVAVASCQRAGVRRRDVVRLNPMFSFPDDLMTGSRVAPSGFVPNSRAPGQQPQAVPEYGADTTAKPAAHLIREIDADQPAPDVEVAAAAAPEALQAPAPSTSPRVTP
jgi:hypothetical protein